MTNEWVESFYSGLENKYCIQTLIIEQSKESIMSDLNEEYKLASPQGKLEILQLIYNVASTSSEEKVLIRKMAQKQYDILKGRDSKQHIMNIINETGFK